MKITVIGGAGVRTVIFINGLLKRYRQLHIDEVVLYDINQEKLEVIGKLCSWVIQKKKEALRIRCESDPVSAIRGADYIVTTLRVGGDHSRVIDETIALKNGVIGQETTGVGGFSMAVRTIPVLLNYCALIKEHAPNAWIFNFTNPSGLVTQALNDAGYDRIIGICDAPSSTKYRMAKYFGIEENRLSVEFFGLNHLSWIRSVKKDGVELMPGLLADNDFLQGVEEFSMFDPGVFKLTGLLPNEYLYYYYHREKALANMMSAESPRGKSIEEINKIMMQELSLLDIESDPEGALQIFLYYMQVRENSYMSLETGGEKRPLLEKGKLEVPEGMGYAGVMLDCIEGMQSEEGKQLILSVVNHGSIPGLDDKDIVEMTCRVSKEGISPLKVQDVPYDCLLMMQQIKNYERLTIKAVMEKSEEEGIRALMLHPLVQSYSLAKKLVEDYSKAYGGLFGGGVKNGVFTQ